MKCYPEKLEVSHDLIQNSVVSLSLQRFET
jgi:hypothetical protein